MSQNECRRCSRKCMLFICTTCVEGTRAQLRDLPWWLDRLIETSVGQAKLSDGGRRSRRRDVLHGDDSLASHIEPFPNEKEQDLGKARRQRQRAALEHALAVGRVNARASDEYDRIGNLLSTWIRDACELRGIETPALSNTADMARWLESNMHSIACQENALQFCDEIAAVTKRVERLVNRPVAPQFIGPCITDPAPDDVLKQREEKGSHETRCNYALTAPLQAKSVTCPQCKQTHADVADVLARNLNDLDEQLVTVRELVDFVLPRLNEVVPQRTIERWINRGWIQIRGHDPSGHQMVTIGDVRRTRAERPRNARAG